MTVLVTTACSKSTERNSLSDRVDFTCSNLSSELTKAAETSREYAGWMAEKRLSPDQQQRVERTPLYGVTEKERYAGAHGLHQQLWFCAMSRADDVRGQELATRAAVLALSALAAELKALPVRD